MDLKKIPIGLQLYSIREDCARDLPGVLAQVAEMGYDGVEFAGYHGRTAEELRRLLESTGLRCCGTHIRLDTLLGDALPATIEFNKVIGNQYLIVPGLPADYTKTLAGWKKAAETLNAVAERCAEAGMRTGYHNHSAEFKLMEGQFPWDVFFSTAREDVIMQLDTGNALEAGVEVSPFIKKYPGRAATVHLKEWTDEVVPGGTAHRSAVIGEGKVPWKTIFRLCETVGATEWYIVEQEVYAAPPMVTVKQCIDNLRRMGK